MQSINSTDSLTIKLAGAPATSNPSFWGSYMDSVDQAVTADAAIQPTALNGATAVPIFASPPAGTTRHLVAFTMTNIDTAAIVVSILLNSTAGIVFRLEVGDVLQFGKNTDAWIVLSSGGATKQTLATLSTSVIADSTDKRYVTDAQRTVLGNTSGTNTGDQTKTSLGLGNVDNTSDANKPVSTAQVTALGLKLDASQKAAASGVCELDSGSLVPVNRLPLAASSHPGAMPALSSKGDMALADGTNVARFPVGPNGCSLFADSSQAQGMAWDTFSARLPLIGVSVPYSFMNGDAATAVAGKIVRLNTTDGKAYLAQSDTLAHCTHVLGAWFDTPVQSASGRVITRGELPVLVTFDGQPVLGEFYLSSITAGLGTSTAPNGTFYPRSLGTVIAVQSSTTAWVIIRIPSDEEANSRIWTMPTITVTGAAVTSVTIPTLFQREMTLVYNLTAGPGAEIFYTIKPDGSTSTGFCAEATSGNAAAGASFAVDNLAQTGSRIGVSTTHGTQVNRGRIIASRCTDGLWWYDGHGMCSGARMMQIFQGRFQHPTANIQITADTTSGIPIGTTYQLKGC